MCYTLNHKEEGVLLSSLVFVGAIQNMYNRSTYIFESIILKVTSYINDAIIDKKSSIN